MTNFNYVTTNDVDTVLNTVLYIAGHPFAVMWGGVVIHFIKAEIDKAHREARKAEWHHVFEGQSMRVWFGIISCLLGYVMTMPSPDELGVVSNAMMNMMRLYAFGLGFFCESIADSFAKKAAGSSLPGAGPSAPTIPKEGE